MLGLSFSREVTKPSLFGASNVQNKVYRIFFLSSALKQSVVLLVL